MIWTAIIVAAAAANAAIAVADLARAPFVMANSAAVAVPETWLPRLAALKLLGAAGLMAGLWWAPSGVAAAIGLTLFYIGAVTAHVRARVLHNLAFPLAYLALAIAAGAAVLT